MKISELKFDNANNSCISLQVLAEMVRQEQVAIKIFDHRPNGQLRLDFEPRATGKLP